MKKLNLIKYILILFAVSQFASCSSWLDVDAQDKIMENEAFGTRKKFLSTLNGVYLEMTGKTLYGGNLSYGIIDVMGQYYNASSDHVYFQYGEYAYAQENVKKEMNNIWSTAYNMIINCNTIIEHCGESNDVLGPQFHPIVKGEAIALRAMLHFDILRLFGPIYSDASKSKACIPYMVTSEPLISPLESSESILAKIIADLETAKTLLANDPVISEGALNFDNPSGLNDLFYRQYRLNYFAVKALLARVYLWKGDKINALKYSTEVIAECQKTQSESIPESDKVPMLFPFVTPEYATHSRYSDRIFHTEVLFGLYNILRNNVYNNSFAPTLSIANILNFAGEFSKGRVSELYTDQNDYRYKMWAEKTVNDKSVVYFQKFIEVAGDINWSTAPYQYMMSLIRISEMYLIAAECTPNIEDAVRYINIVRDARNCISINATTYEDLMRNIIDEFRREMIGEGQMFFMYKRLGMQNIPDGTKATGNKNIALGSYQVPLPDSEINQRPDYVK